MALDHTVTRRSFLECGTGLVAAAGLAAHPACAAVPEGSGRARRSFEIRERCAEQERRAAAATEASNGDEERYPNFIGNYSKGLPHDVLGEVDAGAYRGLQSALRALPDTSGFARVPLGGNQKLVNPMAGVAFDLEGVDIQKLAAPPALTLASAARAGEMVELYWMALCRDVAFSSYESDALTRAGSAEMGVQAARLFRGSLPGGELGPHVSQLLLTPFAYGQYQLDGRLTTFPAGSDYLTAPGAWLACRNGKGPFPPPATDPTPRFFRCGRDLAAYVHSDQACEGFYNAGLRLYALNAPPNPGNPYLLLPKQSAFATFGVPHFLTLQAEAALRAVKAVFYQKWFVHRALRPEAYGGLMQAVKTGRAGYPLHRVVLESEAAARVAGRWGSWLLPQAFPEGCPQHPSYTQAHGGVAGACATILKCAFDGSAPWLSLATGLQEASGDGLCLLPYEAPDAAGVTVNGEIEKLCGNIALGRNFAGVHWRSDYLQGLLLGEAMALTVLADQRQTYGEAFAGFVITKFDGSTITV